MEWINISKNKNYIIQANHIIENFDSPSNAEALLVKDGKIVSIQDKTCPFTPHTSITDKPIIINLQNLTVLPPLIDCHVHLALDGKDFTAARQRWGNPKELEKQILSVLEDTVNHGILAIRDGGDRESIALRFRESLNSIAPTGPIIKASGFALRHPEKYGSFLGRGTRAQEFDNTLDKLVQYGASQVKVIISGVVSFREYGRVGPIHYTAEELITLTKKAHSRGLPVMAHASSDEAVSLALKAEVDSIEHGYFLSKSSLALMAETDTPWIPTVIPVAAQLARKNISLQERRVIKKTVDRQLQMIKRANNLGVILGVGTDAGASGVQHGYGYHEELALYAKAGLKPAEILRCATVNSSRILGINWSIKPGCPAALIAVDGNPMKDISALKNIKYVLMPQRIH